MASALDLSTPEKLFAHRGRGLRPDYFERTMVQLGMADPKVLERERSKRSLARGKNRQAFVDRKKASRAELHSRGLSD